MNLELYGYYRSSAAYRVRIALHYKEIDFDYKTVHLVKDGGEQFSDTYTELNSQQLVPTLRDGDFTLTQSVAILEYLEARYPMPALLPENVQQQAIVRAMANVIACDVHPLDNLRVLKYLKNELEVGDAARSKWYAHWIECGFRAYESLLKTHSGLFSVGDKPSFADLCLIPQVYNANRFKVDLSAYPLIQKINEYCVSLPYFAKAAPEAQIDCEP